MVNLETLLFYIAVAVVVFSISIVIMVFLFGLSMSQTLKNKKGIFGLLLLTLSVTATPALMEKKIHNRVNAQSSGISSIEIVPMDENNLLVTFDTVDLVIGYVIHNDKPYLPTYTLDMRNKHSVVVPRNIFNTGEVYVIAGTEKKAIK